MQLAANLHILYMDKNYSGPAYQRQDAQCCGGSISFPVANNIEQYVEPESAPNQVQQYQTILL